MRNRLILIALLFLVSEVVFAASKPFTFRCRTKVVRNGYATYEMRQHTYNFRIEVVFDNNHRNEKLRYGGYPFVFVNPQERYSVRIYNPMPVRVAVNLAIDGLNVISGDSCSPEDGKKWLLEPYSKTSIEGWQVSKKSLRRFVFTSKERSYAAWKSNGWDKDFTEKCGMIAAAYFFNKRDMERYFERNPIVEWTEEDDEYGGLSAKRNKSSRESDAGTGMGEKEYNPVENVKFSYDTGMYRSREAVKIYYDFYPVKHQNDYNYSKKKHYRYDDDDDDFAEEPDDRYKYDDDDDDEY